MTTMIKPKEEDLFWWTFAASTEVFEELRRCHPLAANFDVADVYDEEMGMAEQIWAIKEELADNPWATLYSL